MDSLDPASPAALTPVAALERPPRIWKFWGTTLWGLFIFAAMFVGQVAVVAWFILQQDGPIDVAAAMRVLGGYGCPVTLPEGGFYLWVPVPAGRWPDAWAMAEALATDGGLLVSPGDLYGEDGAGHVRVAVVQPLERLALVGERLARVRHG